MTANRSASTRRVKPKPAEFVWQGTTYSHSRSLFVSPQGIADGYRSPPDLYGNSYDYFGSYHPRAACGGTLTTDVKSVMYNAHLTVENTPRVLSANELRNWLGDQKLDLLTGLAEYKSTARLFTDIYRPLMKDTQEYVEELRLEVEKHRRHFRASDVNRWSHSAIGIPGVKLTKTMANLHLAYVFGVKPLIGEITGALQLLTEKEPLLSRRLTKTYRVSDVISSGGISTGGIMDGMGYSTTHKVSNTRRYIAYVELDTVTDWRTFARLGINPLSAAWELLPWSFAIDRFIQIGDALQAMGALTGIKRYVVYEVRSFGKVSTVTTHHRGQTFSHSVRMTSRSKPSLTWVPPTVINNFGENQVVTYTALARQNLGKFVSRLLFTKR